MPPDTDPLLPLEAALLQLVVLRLKLRARTALETDLKALEASVGRELPAVRRQLEEICGHDLTPAEPVKPPDGDMLRLASFATGQKPVHRGRPKNKPLATALNATDSDE